MSPRLRNLVNANRNKSAVSLLGNLKGLVRERMFFVEPFVDVFSHEFVMERQPDYSNWCWAAVAMSVSKFYKRDSTWTQCQIAQRVYPQYHCPCHSPTPCYRQARLDAALIVTSNSIGDPEETVEFDTIKTQLSNGRVVGVRTEVNGSGHFVVIHGCRKNAGINIYSIKDPARPGSEIDEAGFLNNRSSSGKWTHTFFTRPKP